MMLLVIIFTIVWIMDVNNYTITISINKSENVCFIKFDKNSL